MKYISLFSGIEAASAAWSSLGWIPLMFSEIEPFPRAVLDLHYPNVPNHGDVTKYQEWPKYEPDVLVGGSPCQSFSVAGLRKGLDDPRGNLMLTYLAVVARYRPKWVVWENVPGVLSSNGGGDFGTFLGALGELGYGFAYRVLDAQFFGVPQRRRRVFVVGCLGDWRGAAAVLFERQSMRGDSAPSREEKKDFTRTIAVGIDEEGNARTEQMGPLLRGGQGGTRQYAAVFNQPFSVANTLTRRMHKGINSTVDEGQTPVVCFAENTRGEVRLEGGGHAAISLGLSVRKLTPVECERLQGFPDNYTRIEWRGKPEDSCPDGHRYKALGNSMAVPVMRWIGERIRSVEAISNDQNN